MIRYIREDIRHYWGNIASIGLPLTFLSILTQKYEGDITIRPLKITLFTFSGLLSNPTQEKVQAALLESERRTWPYMSIIKNHCDIEFTLNECVAEVERRLNQLAETKALETDEGSTCAKPSCVLKRHCSIVDFDEIKEVI